LVVSNPLIFELNNILHTKIGLPHVIISDFVEVLTQDAVLSENTHLLTIDISDKDDIPMLSTALNGKAELFVTGDKELLERRKIQSMRIISPRKFWETLKDQPSDEK
jgi:predicted nucleic acid-binding protein